MRRSPAPDDTPAGKTGARRMAYRFVLLIGVLSFFADFTYEGARSILGPFLASLQASALVVGTVTGFGELAGYALRWVSGRAADTTRRFWLITIAGYLVQMAAVPALALARNWPEAAALIILERIGKAVRNPPRDAMLSYAGQHIGGYGWAFGLHEALDQLGALCGPLLVAWMLARHGDYRVAFAVLAIPALLNWGVLGLARVLYPQPQDMAAGAGESGAHRKLPGVFWLYLVAAGLMAAGFADYPLLAYHLSRSQVAPGLWVAALYAIAMGASGAGSLLFGLLFDRYGFMVLIALSVLCAAFAPLVFLGNFWLVLPGAILWGLGMGVHESIIPAAVSPMVPPGMRATAFGLFTAGYGVFWFAGSAAIGALYDRSIPDAVAFCLLTQLAAVVLLVPVRRLARRTGTQD
jgi:MFS family permease